MTAPHRPRVLIVDDEAVLLRSLRDILRERGYATTGFSDASLALDALRRGRFEVLLADLSMPDMDGITLLRQALAIDPLLVGIIMTGEGTVSTAVEAMRSGAYDFILKPFKISAIEPVLQRGLALRALRLENTLLEQRLRERAAELEAANRELEAFTRSASHDLRTPLSGIAGLCSLIAVRFGSQLPPQAGEWLQRIDGEAHRMARLLDDLMRLSRLGRQVLDLRPVDVSWLVHEVVDELHQREPDRPLEVMVGALPITQADSSLLRQVFVNLLSNAFKFTRRTEHAVISVDCTQAAGQVIYHVRDNGAGFDMARAGKLFEAFHRLHRHSEFEGSGVGLSIVQRIVQRHGGRVWAEAAPQRGACFYFTLAPEPAAATPAFQDAPESTIPIAP